MWPLLLFWDMGLPGVALQLVIGIVGLNLLFGIWRKRVSYVKVRDFTKGHSWCKINSFELVHNFSFNCYTVNVPYISTLYFSVNSLQHLSAAASCWRNDV